MSEIDDTLIGVPLFQDAQKCPSCNEMRRCSHFVNGAQACDQCFAKWAQEDCKKGGLSGNTQWLVKTMHNMIFGPFTTKAIQKWLKDGYLSYTVEVSDSQVSQWMPVTQENDFEQAAKEGRRKMHGDATPTVPIQARVADSKIEVQEIAETVLDKAKQKQISLV